MKCYNAVEIILITIFLSLPEPSVALAHPCPWSLLLLSLCLWGFVWFWFCFICFGLLHIHISQDIDLWLPQSSLGIIYILSLNQKVALLSWEQCGTWQSRGPGSGSTLILPILAGAGDVYPRSAAVPQRERGQVETAISAGRRHHPAHVSQAAGLSLWSWFAIMCNLFQRGLRCLGCDLYILTGSCSENCSDCWLWGK